MKIIKFALLFFILAKAFFCIAQNSDSTYIVHSKQIDLISKSQYLNDSLAVDENNMPLKINQFYFPRKCLFDKRYPETYFFYEVWFSRILRQMKEPLLFNKSENKISFRFTLIPSFDNPRTIRIEKNKDKYFIYWKEHGFLPNLLGLNKKKEISKNDWNKFLQLIDKSDFWNIPSVYNIAAVADGTIWILEGSTQDYYHVAITNMAEGLTDYYQCGLFLSQLTGLLIYRGR